MPSLFMLRCFCQSDNDQMSREFVKILKLWSTKTVQVEIQIILTYNSIYGLSCNLYHRFDQAGHLSLSEISKNLLTPWWGPERPSHGQLFEKSTAVINTKKLNDLSIIWTISGQLTESWNLIFHRNCIQSKTFDWDNSQEQMWSRRKFSQNKR